VARGADAIWLAQQGWDVVAFDVSSTALARATTIIAAAEVEVTLCHGGLLDVELPRPQYDLVNVQYPALGHEDGRTLAAVLDLVAPGGTLLFVHHADVDTTEALEKGFDPADYALPEDVHDAIVARPGWEVLVFEKRDRHVATGAGAGHTADLVLKARRTAS
jgi:SAM-dependent methyltransferase